MSWWPVCYIKREGTLTYSVLWYCAKQISIFDLLTVIRFFFCGEKHDKESKEFEFYDFYLSIQCLDLDYKSKKCSITTKRNDT